MTNYEKLLTKAASFGIKVKEIDFGTDKECGFYTESKALVNINITDKQKYVVLAEEIGHHFRTIGNITDQSRIENRKQEKLARRWAYEEIVGIIDIINAHEAGVKNRYEMAEFLEVTEDFLEYSIQYYKERYGVFFEIDNYIIRFEPTLGVIKRF